MNNLLDEMRTAINIDPTGERLQNCLRSKKADGLQKHEAWKHLTQLLMEYNKIDSPTELTMQIIDSIGNTIDMVIGHSNERFRIYPPTMDDV